MGYIKHDALVVTSFSKQDAGRGRDAAIRIGLPVSPLVESPENGYHSFLIAPDGSKEGWGASLLGDQARAEWKRSVAGFYAEGVYFDWVHVTYAGDEPTDTKIADDSKHSARPPTEHEWASMADEQRLQYLARFPCCRHCGNLDERCQCWNDE